MSTPFSSFTSPPETSLWDSSILLTERAGAGENVVFRRLRAHGGTPSSPTETVDWPIPVLHLTGFGNFTLQTMFALSLPNDPDSFTDDSVWNGRLMQTPSSLTSAGVAGLFIGGPGFLTLNPSGPVCINGYPDSNGGAIVGSGAHRVAALSGYAHSSWDSGDFTAHQFVRGASEVGTITCTAAGTQYTTISDYRLKDVDGPLTGSGDYIDALRPVQGTWKVDGSPFVGLIAHEVQGVSRTRVATGEKDGEQMQGLDYSSAEIIANLIAEMQSLRLRVAALEAAA